VGPTSPLLVTSASRAAGEKERGAGEMRTTLKPGRTGERESLRESVVLKSLS
jgi:hypothetical protein